MRKVLLFVSTLLLAVTTAAAADITFVALEDDVEMLALAPTDDGFALELVGDVRVGNEFVTRLRLARYDTAGTSTVDSGWYPFDLEGFHYERSRLLATPAGFVALHGNLPYYVWSFAVGPNGEVRNEPDRTYEARDIYSLNAAVGTGGHVLMVHSGWFGLWTAWAVPVGSDGRQSGPAINVDLDTADGRPHGDPLIEDIDVAPVSGDFAAAWVEYGNTVWTRELTSRGTYAGPLTLVEGRGHCPANAQIAAVGTIEAIVYTTGCSQRDVFLRTRPKGGAVSAPISIAAEPYFERVHSAVGGSATLGVLDQVTVPTGNGSYTDDTVFIELDLSGKPVQPPVWLHRDLGLEVDYSLELQWDGRRNRFLLSFEGDGPSGPGVYVIGLPARR